MDVARGRQAAVNGRRFASFMDDGQDNHGCSCRAIKGALFVLASQSESGILRCHRILISSPGAVQVVQYPQYPHTNNLYHEVTLDPVSFALSIHKAKVWGRVCKIPKGVWHVSSYTTGWQHTTKNQIWRFLWPNVEYETIFSAGLLMEGLKRRGFSHSYCLRMLYV